MMILRHYITILFLMGWGWNSFAVKIEKKLLYDKHNYKSQGLITIPWLLF